MKFKMVYEIEGNLEKSLETKREFDAILFLSGTLPYPEFNSIAHFAAMKSEATQDNHNPTTHRCWKDGDQRIHCVRMEIPLHHA